MNVWRLRLRSGKEGVEHSDARAFAFQNGWVGAGWGLDESEHADRLADGSSDAEAYRRLAVEIFPGDTSFTTALENIAFKMAPGDHCWAYESRTGEYWCAMVQGAFEYRQGGDFDRHDLHMLRSCKWTCVGTADAVPGAIRRAFAGPFGTVTALTADKARIERAGRTAFGIIDETLPNDLFEAAGPDDLEDLIALYLQSSGWRLYPSTAKLSMASYEFIMVHEETGERAGVQVKSGAVNYLEQSVAGDLDKFFVFLAGQEPRVSGSNLICVLTREDIRDFAIEKRHLLPLRLTRSWNV